MFRPFIILFAIHSQLVIAPAAHASIPQSSKLTLLSVHPCQQVVGNPEPGSYHVVFEGYAEVATLLSDAIFPRDTAVEGPRQ